MILPTRQIRFQDTLDVITSAINSRRVLHRKLLPPLGDPTVATRRVCSEAVLGETGLGHRPRKLRTRTKDIVEFPSNGLGEPPEVLGVPPLLDGLKPLVVIAVVRLL